jgi:type III pantothenate kinase
VDGILARIKEEVPGLKRIVATGGLAAMLAEDSQHIDEVDQEITLRGLKIVWERNRKPGRRRR